MLSYHVVNNKQSSLEYSRGSLKDKVMWYLYLDESGDLGFDFVNKKPSRFFTITILVIKGNIENRLLFNAVKKTLRRRLNPRKKRKRIVA